MKRRNADISPDEIFAESSNLSRFNTSQFEGRIEKPISKRTFLGTVILLFLVFGTLAGRLWYLQIRNGQTYTEISENNRLHHVPVFAERGVIFDRNGEKLAWNIPNQENQDFSLREYAPIPGLAHVVGYVNYPAKDSSGFYYQNYFEGKAGIEKSLDSILRGQNGIKISETDALGNLLSESVIENPVPGENVRLSIDSRIQSKLYTTMEELASRVDFAGGSAVMMNVQTGEILALTNYPEYDNRAFSLGDDLELIEKVLSSRDSPLLNRAIAGVYTPGSIVKPYIGIGALNEQVITPEKKILSTGQIVIPNPYDPDNPSIFKDFKAQGWVDLSDALAVSSNIYFYEIGGGFENQPGIGIEKIGEYMRAFGFGKETGLDLGFEEDGVIPSPVWKEQNFEDGIWRIGDTYHTAIGQYGTQVTPIQVAGAVAAIANGGLVFKPTLLRSDGMTAMIDHTVDVPQPYFEEIRKGMRQAVTDGLATGLNVPYVEIAAKTGTAEVGISKTRVNAWVTGFFPYQNPKYAFVVLMEKGPSDNQIGGVYVVRTVLDWMVINTPEYFNL